MLSWRLLLGLIFTALFALLCWLDHRSSIPGVWLLPVVVLLTVGTVHELVGLFAARGQTGNLALIQCACVLVVLSNWLPHALGSPTPLDWFGWPLLTLTLALMAAFVDEMLRFREPGRAIERLAVTVLAMTYVGLLITCLVQLRFVGQGGYGVAPVVSLVVVVKLADTGAYTVGRLWGHRKLVPVLSPGKTVEGGLGGIAFALIGAWFVFRYLVPPMIDAPHRASTISVLAFGLLVAVFGTVGDLAISLLKRDARRKDSSTWLPGFGGVLDLLDSVLMAAPVALVFWLLRIVCP